MFQPGTGGSVSQLQVTSASRFSGPLPPPDILEKYNNILPGAADRIIAMAESQNAHRQRLEQTVVEANCKAQNRGPIYGFIVSMTAILGGVYLIHAGKSAEGLTSIIGALAGLVIVFFYGKKQQKKELGEKAGAFARQN